MQIRPEMRARYPKDWQLRSRFVRFVRAKNRCEWCFVKNGEHHPLTGSKVVLTTAHVFDKRPEAASLLNLAALCQKCHLAHDAPDRYARSCWRLFDAWTASVRSNPWAFCEPVFNPNGGGDWTQEKEDRLNGKLANQ